ncbi:MAG: RluA family pseudouridine synthase [Betaproteobacteria bacterium]|nr:RluA family pseudouridine synthase [Betaproteobacteria bacterium]
MSDEAPERQAQVLYVAEAEDGIRLDRWFRRRWPHLSNIQVQKMARGGQIRVDGARIKPEGRLTAGAAVRVPPIPEPIVRAPGEHMALTAADVAYAKSLVIYEDDLVIALNKPHGLAVQGGTKTTRHVDRLLSAWGEGMDRPRLVHRLDRDTSGLLMVGLQHESLMHLQQALAARQTHRVYLALVHGDASRFDGITINKPIGRDPVSRVRMACDGLAAKPATTAVRFLSRASFADAQGFSLLSCKLDTGRTHQIRVHLASQGIYLVGDPLYGKSAADRALAQRDPQFEALLLQGQALHASLLQFPHPVSGKQLSVFSAWKAEVDLPLPMAQTLAALWGLSL